MIENEEPPSKSSDGVLGVSGETAMGTTPSFWPGIRVRWLVNLGYAIFLVVIAVLPSISRIADLSVPDWLAHAIAYGIQAALLYWAWVSSVGPRRALLMGLVGATVFGIVTEGLQLFQPGRSVELKDLAANSMGALLASGAIVGARWFGTRSSR